MACMAVHMPVGYNVLSTYTTFIVLAFQGRMAYTEQDLGLVRYITYTHIKSV